MLFSILIPVYNNARTLNVCLRSVTAQDWDGCEKNDVTSCIECGSCAFTCPSNRPLLDNIRVAKQTVMGIIKARHMESITKK